MSTVSVAMTTYNGEKYLESQLLSIYNQARQPDEVIICDDGSADKTVAIAEKFIKTYDLDSKWKIVSNAQNKGFTRNFLECASMTDGDIIFFSDQDDIWHENKIKNMTQLFECNDKIQALTCKVTCINEKGEITESILNKYRKLQGRNKVQQIAFYKQIHDNCCSGLTLAIRRELLNYAQPYILKYQLTFDLPMGVFASATKGYFILGEPLVYRRVHSENVSSPKYTLKSRLNNIESHVNGRNFRLQLMKASLEILENTLSKKEKKQLASAIDILERSKKNLQKRNIIPLIKDVFSVNPMVNRLISITNLLCALYGDYSNAAFLKDEKIESGR